MTQKFSAKNGEDTDKRFIRSEGIKFLEEIHPWGNTRAVMIEGPDRIAIELVEVKDVPVTR